MTDIGADKSEKLAEPGIMIPFEFGLHSFINFPMRAFHNLEVEIQNLEVEIQNLEVEIQNLSANSVLI